MSTITLEFDHKNPIAKKTLDFVLSLGVFKEKESISSLDVSLQEAKKGKTNAYKSVDDFFKKID
jgi:hypothetical protein